MSFKKIILLLILLIPIFVSAEEDEGRIVASEEKYYKTVTILNNSSVLQRANLGEMSSITTEITKEEYDNAPVENYSNARTTDDYTDATIETTYKKMKATIREFYGAYRYKNVLTWKNIPSTRSYDIIALGYYASVQPVANIYFEQDYCTSSSSCYTGSSYYEYIGTNGSAALFYLPSGTLTSLEQSLRVDMEKTNSSSTIVSQVAVADYSHATSSISYSNAKKFTVDTGGIRLNDSITGYYDAIGVARASWEGEW